VSSSERGERRVNAPAGTPARRARACSRQLSTCYVMPGLSRGIHVLMHRRQGVAGRDKPGHGKIRDSIDRKILILRARDDNREPVRREHAEGRRETARNARVGETFY